MSNAHGLVDLFPASHADEPGSTLSESKNFFLFFSLFFFVFFNKTTWMGVFSQINNCQQKQNKKQKQKTDKTRRGAPLLGLAKSIYYQVQGIRATCRHQMFRCELTLFVALICAGRNTVLYV